MAAAAPKAKNFNWRVFCPILNNQDRCLEWCKEHNLLSSSMKCPRCDNDGMTLKTEHHSDDAPVQYYPLTPQTVHSNNNPFAKKITINSQPRWIHAEFYGGIKWTTRRSSGEFQFFISQITISQYYTVYAL